MRVRECHIKGFGPIRDLKLPDLDHPIVVVEGPNEAGKSTFFEFLKSMLYGIYPTRPEKHDYRPWSGDPLQGDLAVGLTDGSQQEITRRLVSTPETELRNGSRVKLRNDTFPPAAHISSEIFDALYALTLGDMAALQKRPWNEVQERLLGGWSLDSLRPVSAVVSELEKEANALWRSDNRGSPRAKGLQKRIRELSGQIREARRRQSKVFELASASRTERDELDSLKKEQRLLQKRLARADRLNPVRRLLVQLRENSRRAGPVQELAEFPADVSEELKRLDSRLGEMESALSERRRQIDQTEQALDEPAVEQKRLLGKKTDLEFWTGRLALYDKLQGRRIEAEAAHKSAKVILDNRSTEIFGSPWSQAFQGPLQALNVGELRSLVSSFHNADRQPGQDRGVPKAAFWTLVLGAAAGLAAATAWAALTGSAGELSVLESLAVVLLAAGAAYGCLRILLTRPGPDRRTEQGAEIVSDLRRSLQDLPLPESRLKRPDLYLVQELQSVREALGNFRAAEAHLKEISGGLRTFEEDFSKWLGASFEEADLERWGAERSRRPDEAVPALELALKDAEKRMQAYEEQEKRKEDLAGEAAALQDRKAQVESCRKELETKLLRLCQDGLPAAIEVLEKRRSALASTRSAGELLDADYPDWEALEQEIEDIESEAGEWPFDRATILDLQQRVEEIQSLITEKSARVAEVGRDLKHLQTLPAVDELESQLEMVRTELQEARLQRDRLALLAELVRYGQQRFQEKYQPNVLSSAADYVNLITRGRYVSLEIDEKTGQLTVTDHQGLQHPVSEPLSQGTRDQIYLVLRLALVSQLDQDKERLPLFLDEVLVNWDGRRRQGGIELLQRISSERQIFFFTCHRWLSEEIVQKTGARLIRLPTPAV